LIEPAESTTREAAANSVAVGAEPLENSHIIADGDIAVEGVSESLESLEVLRGRLEGVSSAFLSERQKTALEIVRLGGALASSQDPAAAVLAKPDNFDGVMYVLLTQKKTHHLVEINRWEHSDLFALHDYRESIKSQIRAQGGADESKRGVLTFSSKDAPK